MAEAVSRWLRTIHFSIYFDDGTLQDWKSTARQAEANLAEHLDLLGSLWAEAKKQECLSNSNVLGLEHSVGAAHSGVMTVWPRTAPIEKAKHIMQQGSTHGFQRGIASKLRGHTNFLQGGMFRRIGRLGLSAIRDRQSDRINTSMTLQMRRASALLHDLLRIQLQREYQLFAANIKRIV